MTSELSEGQLRASGIRAARSIYAKGPRKARFQERYELAYARAALGELERLIVNETPGLFAEQHEGMDASAEELHVQPERALAEIAQNADDCRAGQLRFALRDGPRGRELLCAHDGERICLRDAVGMTFAYISGKRDDARSKGKFGIGLKTIAGMARSFEAHCHPYHFEVERQHPRWIEPHADIPGFWEAASGATLLVLHLHPGYDGAAAVQWVRDWGTDSMLFLDTLRTIEFSDLERGMLARLAVEVEPAPAPAGLDAMVRVIRDAEAPATTWTTYLRDVVAPPTLSRAHKRRERTTPVGVAIPGRVDATRIFAGLPLDEPCDLPFSVHGQFDPDSQRAQVRKTGWNQFVLECVGDLAADVLIARLATSPASTWHALPLADDSAGRDSWTHGRFDAVVRHVRARVANEGRLPGHPPTPLRDVVFEAEELSGVLTPNDLLRLEDGGAPLLERHRDAAGHWRGLLADLECGTEVTGNTAAAMFDWDDAGARGVAWFAHLIDAIAASYDGQRTLHARHCLVLTDGRRITLAEAASRGAMLARDEARTTLAHHLGLVERVDADFVDTCDGREHAKRWLRDVAGVSDKPASAETLDRLAQRRLGDPLVLDSEHVRMLRDELNRLGSERRDALALEIGRRIKVRGYEVLGASKREEVDVVPAEAYLPARIDGQGVDGFHQAAGAVAGLRWIHSSFADLLKTERASRKLSARALFVALGAHSAPRLKPRPETSRALHNERAATFVRPRLQTQQAAIGQLGGIVDGVRNDLDSPDLVKVLDQLGRMRGDERRVAARALVLSIDRAWDDVYAPHTQAIAMRGHMRWYSRGPLPATWLSRLQSTPFLSNEAGHKKCPVELALRSAAYVAVIGDSRTRFCREVSDGELSAEVVEALGFEARPRAGRLVDQLRALRDAEAAGTVKPAEAEDRARVTYLALAGYCGEVRSAGARITARDVIDDLPVERLRARFAEGLIRANGAWCTPNQAFTGAPIFGERRPFVPTEARELWEVLHVRAPSTADCVAVLTEIEREPGPPNQALLTDIYLRLEEEFAQGRRPRTLKKLPLWVDDEWVRERPVYAIPQEGLARDVGREMRVWSAPCALSLLSEFVPAAGITVLDSERFEPQGIKPGHRSAGGKLRPQFVSAMRAFAELVGRHHPEVHRSPLVTFDALEGFDLAHSSRLEVLVESPEGTRSAAVEVFASVEASIIAFRDVDALGRLETGGMAIAALFGPQWTTDLAPLWEVAWTRADPDNVAEKVRIAREEEVIENLLETLIANGSSRRPTKALDGATPDVNPVRVKPTAHATRKPPPRRILRDLSTATFGAPTIAGADTPGSHKRRTRGPLKPPSGGGAPSADGGTSSARGIREYDEQQKETKGFELLAKALARLDGAELGDYRALRNVGADGVDGLGRYFELKAHEGDLPDEITLTGSEFERALRERENFFLAVVGGLESGEVLVRVFANPLHTLDVVESRSIKLGGIRTREALEFRLADEDC